MCSSASELRANEEQSETATACRPNRQVVAAGDAELGIAVTSLLLVSGVELVGKIPEELQLYLIFTATVGDTAKQPEAAGLS